MLATPAVARERHVTSRHLAEDANASITPGALAEVTGFAAITLAAVVLQVTVIAVTVTAQAVCMADRSDTGAAMCGAARAPTMGPWFRRRLELGPSPPLRSRRASPVRLGGIVLATGISAICSDFTRHSISRARMRCMGPLAQSGR
jgi:hypothetical protein